MSHRDDAPSASSLEQHLHETESRLAALSDNLPGGLVYQIDSGVDGTLRRFTYLSGGIERLHEVTIAEAMADPMKIYGQVDPADLALVAEREAAAFATLTPIAVEVRVTLPSGAQRWRYFASAPRRLATGNVVWDGLELDVTERRLAEEARRESDELRRRVFESSRLPIVVMDPETHRFIDCNPAAVEIYRLPSREALLGKIPVDVSAPVQYDGHPSADLARFYIEQAKGTGSVVFDWLHQRPDGERWDAEVHLLSFAAAGDRRRYLQFTLVDVTERRRALEELRRSEERYRTIVETTTEWIWEIDRSGRHTFSNPRIRDILGYAPEELVGRTADHLLHEEDRLQVAAALPGLLAERRGWTGWVLRWRHRDGTFRYLESSARPLLDDTGEVVGFHGSDRDVTERRRAEEQRLALQEQLHQAQKLESVGRLAGGVAHDFNNMIGVILGNVGLALEDAPRGHPLRVALEEIQRAAERSADLTRQLLAFARRQPVSPQVIDLNETVESTLQMLRRLIGEDVELVFRPTADLGPVRMDPAQLDQILANLCVNARDAMVAGGRITIETANARLVAPRGAARAGNHVRLTLSDDGSGMDEATVARLFEPFFTTKELGKGTGLGLATVHGIVEQNQGCIEVRSVPGQGTTFVIHLPWHEVLDGRVPAPKPPAVAPAGQETILLVEDELQILRVTRAMLERLGYQVLAASGPAEALAAARSHPGELHLLMTDVVMPGMSGPDLARALRDLHPRLRWLFVSGYSAEVVTAGDEVEPGLHFLQKPFDQRSLAAAVRAALESA